MSPLPWMMTANGGWPRTCDSLIATCAMIGCTCDGIGVALALADGRCA
jgi:hypothetical protein